jgi:ATP-dependent HslUV protease ATP-binding subunit HslU
LTGELDNDPVEVEVPSQQRSPEMPTFTLPGNITAQFQGFEKFMANFSGRRERRTLPVCEARTLLEESAAESMFPPEFIAKEAIRVTEQDGIVFIDEIDKIVEPKGVIRHGECWG